MKPLLSSVYDKSSDSEDEASQPRKKTGSIKSALDLIRLAQSSSKGKCKSNY